MTDSLEAERQADLRLCKTNSFKAWPKLLSSKTIRGMIGCYQVTNTEYHMNI